MNPFARAYSYLRAVAARFAKAASRLARPRLPAADAPTIVVHRLGEAKKKTDQLRPGTAAWDRTFETVKRIISAHESGDFAASALLADALDRNPRIHGALNNRCLGVVGSPFTILPGLGHRQRVGAAAKALEADWPTIAGEETTSEVLRGLVTMGFCLCVVNVVRGRGRWIPRLTTWHPTHLRYDWDRQCFIALTAQGEVEVVPGDGRWVLFSAARSRPWMRGVLRCLGLVGEARAAALRDWNRWSEKHGLPIVELQVPDSKAESEDTQVWFDQMRDLATDTTIVSPQGDDGKASYKVNLIEPKDPAHEGFKTLIERQDGDVSIAIEGSNLSTENASVGAKASAQTGIGVKQDLREADAYLLATAFYDQVLRLWALWNYGDADLAPWAVYDPTPPEDLARRAETQTAAAGMVSAWQDALGKFTDRTREVDVDAVAEEYGVRLRVVDAAPAQPPEAADDETDDELPEVRAAHASARRFLHRQRYRMAA